MSKYMDIEEVLAKSLVTYNNSKRISVECEDHEITKFCNQRIISFCNAIERNEKSGTVIECLAKMKDNHPQKDMIDIEHSIRDLQVERYAVQLTDHGQAKYCSMGSENYEQAEANLNECCEQVPTELITDVKDNLSTKQEMKEFNYQSTAISNALNAINIVRNEDLNSIQNEATEMTE